METKQVKSIDQHDRFDKGEPSCAMGMVVAKGLQSAGGLSMSVNPFSPLGRARAAASLRIGLLGVAGAALLVGCATSSQRVSYKHGKEYFAQGKYGKASPKVVADGEPVPRGGGQYLVGRPYRVAGRTYVPTENPGYTAVGMASWYGAAFHGRRTSNGEVYDMASITAAHPTMPLPSYARVTNLGNGYSVIVRVNDRGPFHGGRVMDVSSRTADILNFKGAGTAKIKVEYVGRAPMEGSDDNALFASLRTDGSPASLPGYAAPAETMIADAGPSLFGGFGSPGRSAPPPPPEPVVTRPEPPTQVVAAEPEPAPAKRFESLRDSADEGEAPKPTRTAAFRGPAPLPPPRPFDLGEIRASVAIAAADEPKPRPPALIGVVTPPRKPIVQASAGKALYFATPPERARQPGALDKIRARSDDD